MEEGHTEEQQKEQTQSAHHVPEKKLEHRKRNNYWMISTLALLVLLVVSLFTGGFDLSKSISKEEASTKALDFVNQNLLQGQAVAQLGALTEEAGLYSMELNIAGQQF